MTLETLVLAQEVIVPSEFGRMAVNGLSLGAIYAVLALGFVIIFKATQVINFAHGALAALGAFFIAYFAAKQLQLPHNVAAPAALIGTSNFFELAVAVAISLFGLHSGAALATVVGVLVEVPVMLSLVKFANNTRGWFPRAV